MKKIIEKIRDIDAGVFIAALMGIGVIFYKALVLYKIWQWFFPDLFLPRYEIALGLMFAKLLTGDNFVEIFVVFIYNTKDHGEEAERFNFAIIYFLGATAVLALAWIVHVVFF